MPTIEYKIRKLAEILEEQHGIYLEDFTLSEEAWGKWLEEHNAIKPSGAFYIRVGGRKIRVNLRGANDPPLPVGLPPGGSLPHNRQGLVVPFPAITPQVPMTPPEFDLQQHIDRQIEKKELGDSSNANTLAVDRRA